MSYDKPNRIKHVAFVDLGNTGNKSLTFRGPEGKKGRLIDYGIEGVTEVFTQDASIAIGDGSDVDAYGEELALGALAAGGQLGVRSQYDPIANKTAFDALIVNPNINADSFVMTLVDDAATGMGMVYAVVDWDD